ncbi:MAG TPA: serine/threonine-protein kinase [Gemmataceae bacterium]|nr:serine/threonine-protein kinase [Gemmataceae bacterium]
MVPLPGYTLLQPLGRGGFGEVWKCEAPGGLMKAIKFVANNPNGTEGEQLRQEFTAFQQIKQIRHPFMLTLERVEMVGNDLVMVMELADEQLQDRFRECVSARLPGIPRDELLGYLADAAEALDVIGAKYNLQHLDVKPANLFLIAGHVKVGDYGLVSSLLDGANTNRGLTPRYVAPEVLRNQVHTRSDQYSLALVYHELLTGSFPYPARTAQQMMLQHVTVPADVSALPPGDQPIVLKALSKQPEERFGSCMAFIRALMLALNPDIAARQARLDRTHSDLFIPASDPHAGTDRHPYPDPSAVTGRHPPPPVPPSTVTGHAHRTSPQGAPETAESHTLRSVPPITVTGRNAPGGGALPQLVSASQRIPAVVPRPAPAPPQTSGPPDDDGELLEAAPIVKVDPIRSVVPVAALLGEVKRAARVDPANVIEAVMAAAVGGGKIPQMPGDIGQLADGTWVTQFPSTVPQQVVPHKLAVLREKWGVAVEQPEPTRIVLKKVAATSLWGSLSGKRHGLEVVVHLPPQGKSAGEVTATGTTFGAPDPQSQKVATDLLPKILTDVRRELQNVEDRRKSPRVATAMPVTVYPIHADGAVDDPIPAQSRDVSAGGASLTTATRLPTKYMYLVFDGVPAVAGVALLARLIRRPSQSGGQDHVAAVQYRTDL